MATATSTGVRAKGTRQNNATTPAKSIEETLANFYEALALAVEHPECPPSLAIQIHEFVQEITVGAENINAPAVQAAKLRHFLPRAVLILNAGDQSLRELKAA